MISMNDIKKLRVGNTVIITVKSRRDSHIENVIYRVTGVDSEKVALRLVTSEITPMISEYIDYDHIDLKTGIMNGNLHKEYEAPINVPEFMDGEYIKINYDFSEQFLELAEALNS